MSKDRVNPEDCEAVSDALMREAGVEFGKAAGIYTEKQIRWQIQCRKDLSLDALPENFVVRSSQEILELARDELRAGQVAGIDDDQRSILLFMLADWTQREIADHVGKSVGWVNDEIKAIRLKIDDCSSVWLWLVLAEVFRQSVPAVRDDLRQRKN